MKILYSLPGDSCARILIGAPKANIERDLNKSLTDEEYSAIIVKSLPEGTVSWRKVDDSDIPKSREFRSAWVDVTDSSKVDIDLQLAKDAKLATLRAERTIELEKLDKEFLKALSMDDQERLSLIKVRQQELRDATEPLKALEVDGYNDTVVLANIRSLGTLKEIS